MEWEDESVVVTCFVNDLHFSFKLFTQMERRTTVCHYRNLSKVKFKFDCEFLPIFVHRFSSFINKRTIWKFPDCIIKNVISFFEFYFVLFFPPFTSIKNPFQFNIRLHNFNVKTLCLGESIKLKHLFLSINFLLFTLAKIRLKIFLKINFRRPKKAKNVYPSTRTTNPCEKKFRQENEKATFSSKICVN